MLVEITQKHIEAALKNPVWTCPIKEALSELFDTKVCVGYNYWNLADNRKLYEMPSKARSFAVRFDAGSFDKSEIPKPTSIEFGDVSLNDQKEILLQGIKIHSLA